MNDFDYVAMLGTIYNSILEARRDEDYAVNAVQLGKLIEIVEFFMEQARRLDGELEPVRISPREEHVGVTAYFPVFDLCGGELQAFCRVMQGTSGLCIDPLADRESVCVSCTVPDVFARFQ